LQKELSTIKNFLPPQVVHAILQDFEAPDVNTLEKRQESFGQLLSATRATLDFVDQVFKQRLDLINSISHSLNLQQEIKLIEDAITLTAASLSGIRTQPILISFSPGPRQRREHCINPPA
jgi:hypothetical protein